MYINAIQWSISPEIFTFGTISVRWYGLFFALSFILGQYVMQYIFKEDKKPAADVDALTLYAIIGTLVGARMGHFLFYEFDLLFSSPLEWFKQMVIPPYAGLASHGASIGLFLAFYFFIKKHPNYNYLWITDRVVIVVALAGFFIRLGNLMNSEIVGKPSDLPWAFLFFNDSEHVPTVPRHPAQLYESLSSLLLFFFLFWLWKNKRSILHEGALTGLFMVILFTLRFFYEFLKENQESFENNLAFNMGQYLSIPAILFGVYVFFYNRRRT